MSKSDKPHKLEVHRPHFQKCLTHDSYFAEKGKGNSRWVFLGMFSFKGLVSEVLYSYIPLYGQVLQQILGNHFSNKRMHQLYDEWSLTHYVRADEKFDIQKHRHIFVYAYLGWLTEVYDREQMNSFITTVFLDDDILSKAWSHTPNHWEQLRYLCKSRYGCNPKRVTSISDEHIHQSIITVEGKEIARHTSKSSTYAIKKTIEKALKYISELEKNDHKEFLAVIEERKRSKRKAENLAKHEAFLAENQEKKRRREERKKQQKIESAEREKKRIQAKQNVKKAKERRNVQKIEITSDMNAAKRRRLEDKLK